MLTFTVQLSSYRFLFDHDERGKDTKSNICEWEHYGFHIANFLTELPVL